MVDVEMMASDGELLMRWRGGDREAFAALYARNSGRLYVYLLSLVGQEEAAQDLLQETFMRILTGGPRRSGRRVNGNGSLGPYLAATARNLATDWRRRQGRDQRAREAIGRARLLAAAERLGPLSAAEAGELLWRLPPEQREAVILRVYVNLTFKEIARLTGAPQNTAISRYRYGLEKIRDAIEEVPRGTEKDL
jgi:RNA polymerase sigma-70 factor (ECF subfamily)